MYTSREQHDESHHLHREHDGALIIFRGSSFTKEACKLWRKRDLSNSEIFLLRFIFGCYFKKSIIGYRAQVRVQGKNDRAATMMMTAKRHDREGRRIGLERTCAFGNELLPASSPAIATCPATIGK